MQRVGRSLHPVGAVSIRTRLTGRVMRFERNPNIVWKIVSIRTRLTGRVMPLALFLPARPVKVSIRTRLTGRVMLHLAIGQGRS